MLILIVCYVSAIFYVIKNFVKRFEVQCDKSLAEMEASYQELLKVQEDIIAEKLKLEKDLEQIFTLYEMTKEIIKKFNEEEAFQIFVSKLRSNASFQDCQLVGVASLEEKEAQNDASRFVFPLKSKREKLGYLVLKDLREEDKDKVMILGHQFALALRRVKLYQEIEELAMTDSLTGVSTRRHFLARFEEELKRSAARKIDLSFLMIDVDYFKSFNDKYGHLVGDQILREVGKLIREHIREIDIVGRYGGEEFCVVLPVTDRDGAHFAAERIRVAIEEAAIKAYDAVVKVSVSIGIANFPLDGKSTIELIDKSDWALYRAKKKGRNCICAFGVYEE